LVAKLLERFKNHCVHKIGVIIMYSTKSNKRLSLTCLALGMGLSMSIYAATPNPDLTPTTTAAPATTMTKVETTTTKTEVVKKVHHHAAHAKKHVAASESASTKTEATPAKTETTADGAAGAAVTPATGSTTSNYTPKHTVMKNGIILNDVEPVPGGAQSSPFGTPASTNDTIKGGVTISTQ
jgi:hypothetical protein